MEPFNNVQYAQKKKNGERIKIKSISYTWFMIYQYWYYCYFIVYLGIFLFE